MVPGHPSRSALSTPPITSSRISAQPTTRHRRRGERGGRGTTSSRTTTRAANELSPPKSACAGDAVLRTSTRGTVHMGQCAGCYRGPHLTVSISTNDLGLLYSELPFLLHNSDANYLASIHLHSRAPRLLFRVTGSASRIIPSSPSERT